MSLIMLVRIRFSNEYDELSLMSDIALRIIDGIGYAYPVKFWLFRIGFKIE